MISGITRGVPQNYRFNAIHSGIGLSHVTGSFVFDFKGMGGRLFHIPQNCGLGDIPSVHIKK
jgi:hypothetical protein